MYITFVLWLLKVHSLETMEMVCSTAQNFAENAFYVIDLTENCLTGMILSKQKIIALMKVRVKELLNYGDFVFYDFSQTIPKVKMSLLLSSHKKLHYLRRKLFAVKSIEQSLRKVMFVSC